MQAVNAPVKKRLLELLDELIAHDGFGSIKVDIRLLKRGQKRSNYRLRQAIPLCGRL